MFTDQMSGCAPRSRLELVSRLISISVLMKKRCVQVIKKELETHDSMWLCKQAHIAKEKGQCSKGCGSATFFKIVRLPWFVEESITSTIDQTRGLPKHVCSKCGSIIDLLFCTICNNEADFQEAIRSIFSRIL